MNRPLSNIDVLTLAEAAKYLRVKRQTLRSLAESGQVPAQNVNDEWIFLKAALQDWLRGKPDYRQVLLHQAGALADDDTLPELLASIYKARGRPEVEPED